jgi:hypothetical protein
MAKPEKNDATNNLSPAQEALRKLWEEHVQYEFSSRNTEDTLATMVEDAYGQSHTCINRRFRSR